MTSNRSEVHEFYASHCAPILEKYRNDDNFIVTTSDGIKMFDVQLAMMNEGGVFSPVLGCDNKIIGFAMVDHPEYLFVDIRGASDADNSSAPDILCYALRRFAEHEQKTSVITYSGFRDAYVSNELVTR